MKSTLGFWGNWFGKPYDNIHRVTMMQLKENENCLLITFDKDERLFIWKPKGIKVSDSRFLIKNAFRVKWEWFYYGKPKVNENLYYQEFTKKGLIITAKTNVDWYKPECHSSIFAPAVEICTIKL